MKMSLIKEIKQFVLSLFFPNRCIFCGELTDAFTDMCDGCDDTLPWITGEICMNCGCEKEKCGCGKKHGHFYEGIVAPLYYEGNVKKCIHDFKFNDYRENCNYLAKLMADSCMERYHEINFDYVTYIPMEKKSQSKRGFNQSRLLAESVAQKMNVSFGDEMLIKLYRTKSQHNCPEIRRKGNLMGVFDVNKEYNLDGKTVLIVDDIKTSGSTLSECGKMLYLYGAEHVFCLTAALVNSKIKDRK